MAADSLNIIAATIPATGAAVSAAPLGSTEPTDATSALDGAFIDLGWAGPDGVINSIKRDTTKHYAWGGEVVKVTQDKYTETITVTLLESSAEVLEAVFGTDNVTGTGAVTVEHSSLMLERQMFAFDFIDGDATGRILVREGQITEIGDIKYVHDDLTSYELTIDVFKTGAGDPGVVTFFDSVGGGS